MREMPGVDVVTRLYDLADLPCLDRLMFSIMAQGDAVPLRLHVMLQRFSFTEVQSVREATRRLRGLNDHVSLTLHNWDYPAPFDLRVPLLNWGLEVALGRYVTYLDVHDQLRPGACAMLLARLCGSAAAVALGATALQSVWWWGDVVLPVPDQRDATASIPLLMIDRTRLAIKDCVFRSGEPGLEIDEFIKRIGTSYAIDTTGQSDIMAIRQHSRQWLDAQEAAVTADP